MKTKTAIFLFAALLSAGGFVSAENAGIDPAPADSAASANAAANNPNKPLDDPPPKPDEPSVADPVGVVSGVVRDRETDFFVRCPGIDLVFQRVFDGEFTASRDLPEGWCHNYEWRIVRTGANQDRAELRALSNPGGVSAFHAFRRGIDGTWGVSDNAPFVLSENADGTWLVKAPGPVLYRFGADGWLDSITARTGETVSVDRGSDRRHVLRVSHACGRSLVFRYGPDGVVSSIRADDGTALEYERIPDREDPSGRVVSWTDEFRRVSAGGDVAAMRYEGRLVPAEAGGGAVIRDVGSFESLAPRQPDSSVQLCKEPIVAKTDENGSVTTYVYRRYMDSPRGRVVFTSTDTAYFVNRFHHETGKTEVTADLGGGNARTSVYEYDPETRRVRSRAVGSLTFETVWSPRGDPVRRSASDSDTGSSFVRETEFGLFHNPVRSSAALDADPDPADAWSAEWDEDWLLPRKRISPEGRISEVVRDASARTVTACGAGAGSPRLRTLVQCDENWRPFSSTNANGVATVYGYDEAGQLVRVRTGDRPEAGYAYDTLGHVREKRLPGPDGTVRVTSATNNPFGLPLRIEHADGSSESFAYDNTWRQETAHVDELGRTDRYRNYLGMRLHAGRTAAGSTNEIPLYSFEVDKQLDVVSIVDPAGRRAETYALDDQGRIACATNLEGQAETFHYRLGNLVDRIDRFDGTTVSIGYDTQARPVSVSYPGETLSFAYDRDGLLLAASNSVGVVSASYDETGWATNAVGADGLPLAYTYHDGGQVASVSSVAGTTSYALDGSDRLASIAAPQAAFAYSYGDWNGLVSAVTNAAGLSAEYAYDLRDRVTNIVWRGPSGAEIAHFGYERDAAGRIVARTIDAAGRPARRVEYGYDDLDRLVSETGTEGASTTIRTYAYDRAGNRLSVSADGATVAYSYDDANRILSCGSAVFTHDAAGCVTSILGGSGSGVPSGRRLVWNSQYQLVRVEDGAGALLESYEYDALGRRVSTTDASGATVRHVYDGKQCIADIDENGTVLRAYVWGPGIDNLLAIRTGGAVYYALVDHQNTVHGFVDANGATVARYEYDAWGDVRSETVSVPALTGNRYLFQGREYSHATGFCNFRARWYDPATGRWLSKDPIGLSGGLNLYEFCGSSPVDFADPTGLERGRCKDTLESDNPPWPPNDEPSAPLVPTPRNLPFNGTIGEHGYEIPLGRFWKLIFNIKDFKFWIGFRFEF